MKSLWDNKITTEYLPSMNQKKTFKIAMRFDEENYYEAFDLSKNWNLIIALVITQPELTFDYIQLLDN